MNAEPLASHHDPVSAGCRAFDTNNTRTLAFDEFQRLHFFLVNVQNSFYTFDRDRSGKLTPDEVANALKQAGELG